MTFTEYQRNRRARLACEAQRGKQHYWTAEEDRLAREMRGRGKSCGQISLRVLRTPDAVYTHLRDVKPLEA